jgi:hypothetical protein
LDVTVHNDKLAGEAGEGLIDFLEVAGNVVMVADTPYLQSTAV